MGVEIICENCGKRLLRSPSAISKHNYCSHSCAVKVNNRIHPRNPGVLKYCAQCGKAFKSREKYCSAACQHLGASIPESILLGKIKEFVKKNGRIPYKWEVGHYSAARKRFGTWNKAIEAAGFVPNPVMFAKKYIANDGDKCDSLAEKIIDDYLFRRKIKHTRNFPYPGSGGFMVDFKVRDNWIEFFGLSGQLKRYDELMYEKIEVAKKNKLKLIKIYPRDLYPKGKLNIVLRKII